MRYVHQPEGSQTAGRICPYAKLRAAPGNLSTGDALRSSPRWRGEVSLASTAQAVRCATMGRPSPQANPRAPVSPPSHVASLALGSFATPPLASEVRSGAAPDHSGCTSTPMASSRRNCWSALIFRSRYEARRLRSSPLTSAPRRSAPASLASSTMAWKRSALLRSAPSRSSASVRSASRRRLRASDAPGVPRAGQVGELEVVQSVSSAAMRSTRCSRTCGQKLTRENAAPVSRMQAALRSARRRVRSPRSGRG